MGNYLINNIIKLLLLLAFALCSNVTVFGQNNQNIIFPDLKKEINDYIDSTGRDPYAVYVLKLSYSDEGGEGSFCFSLSYILNSFDYVNFFPKHFFQLGDEYVIVLHESAVDTDVLGEVGLKSITLKEEIKIVRKLFPSVLRQMTYAPSEWVYCFDGLNISKTVYADNLRVLKKFSTRGNLSDKIEIKIIRSE